MDLEGQCRWPKPKVIPVKAELGKTYTPHCTVLHRCGADTGCCIIDKQVCVAKRKQTVDLYFIVSATSGSETYERRSFENHTECECVDRESIFISSPLDLEPNPLLSCTCPMNYTGRVDENGTCKCDCDDRSPSVAECLIQKSGESSFSYYDRR